MDNNIVILICSSLILLANLITYKRSTDDSFIFILRLNFIVALLTLIFIIYQYKQYIRQIRLKVGDKRYIFSPEMIL